MLLNHVQDKIVTLVSGVSGIAWCLEESIVLLLGWALSCCILGCDCCLLGGDGMKFSLRLFPSVGKLQ